MITAIISFIIGIFIGNLLIGPISDSFISTGNLVLTAKASIKPLYIVIIVIIEFIRRLITIIDFVFAPNHIISRGPNDTFGRLLNNVKKGSKNFFNTGIK